jgi:hypothetical protein
MIDKKRKLPSFKSDSAECKFWGRHSVEEFRDELEDIDVQIRPARSVIALLDAQRFGTSRPRIR